MRTKLYLLSVLFTFIFAAAAMAHPLGNFSVNQYSRLEVEKSVIKIRQVLDLAEIPTFQEQAAIDADKDGTLSEDELNAYAERITPQFLANLRLSVNNQPLEIRAESKEITTPPGAGNLPTLRIEWNLIADLPNNNAVNQVVFENKNYAERLGWNEIVVNRLSGINVFDSTAFGSGITDELKAYPQETLNAPLSERTAQFSYAFGAMPENAVILQNRDGHKTAAVQTDRLAELIAVPEVTPSIILFGLFLAFGLGAIHAMSPGHGKAVVGAYLVGSKGTPKHAIFLGLTVTITHTLGVFALGLITLFASNYILPERLIPFLSFVSGLLVLYIGLTMFKSRLFTLLGWEKAGHHHGHSHDHAPDQEHSYGEQKHQNHSPDEHSHDNFTHTHDGNTHTHLPPENISWKSLLALGISGGLLPCPSALVLMLSAISLNRVGYGIVLTLVFSFGLAATLTAVGLLFLYVGKAFGNSGLAENRILKTLPVFSALIIACLGAVICYNSL
ncbi:MAG: sulfite exporter TauE/SafE family protein [Acidobacteriota bacterium]|nr:sulfite exporter TauE/SafE family protein [Acidobacteriota bacterium]